jgi:hypothetical protein
MRIAMAFDSLEEAMQTRESAVYAWLAGGIYSAERARPLENGKKDL